MTQGYSVIIPLLPFSLARSQLLLFNTNAESIFSYRNWTCVAARTRVWVTKLASLAQARVVLIDKLRTGDDLTHADSEGNDWIDGWWDALPVATERHWARLRLYLP
jgi:hypothetical protein